MKVLFHIAAFLLLILLMVYGQENDPVISLVAWCAFVIFAWLIRTWMGIGTIVLTAVFLLTGAQQ